MTDRMSLNKAVEAYHRLYLAKHAAALKARFDAVAEELGLDRDNLERDLARITKEADAAVTDAGIGPEHLARFDASLSRLYPDPTPPPFRFDE